MSTNNLEQASPEQLRELVASAMWFWGNLHQRWRNAVEDEYGLDAAIKLECRFIGDVGRSHARRIKQIFPLEKGIPGFLQAFQFGPENFVESFQLLEQTDKHLAFCNPSCSAQLARRKRGKPEYPCREAGILYFNAFAREIDPAAVVTCVACPPDDHPGFWCKWKLEIP